MKEAQSPAAYIEGSFVSNLSLTIIPFSICSFASLARSTTGYPPVATSILSNSINFPETSSTLETILLY